MGIYEIYEAYFIDFSLFPGTVTCEQLKILVKLDYTKQVCFHCFHLKKIKTEKRLTLLTLCHAFLIVTDKS